MMNVCVTMLSSRREETKGGYGCFRPSPFILDVCN
jgi:hypothetical protein